VRDFAELERDFLSALKHDGVRLLEQSLNDPEFPQPKAPLEPGEQHGGYRTKVLLINLGWITLRRPYHYHPGQRQGRCPLDSAWGFVDSYSPEVLRLSCRAAASSGSYDAASQDLLTYAGLAIDPKQLQRLVAAIAPVMNRWREAQQPAPAQPVCGEVMCIGTDGTGAPMRRAYLRGRKGKRGGRARTREVKVGTVFTHRRPTAPDQRPERDHQSTSYLAAIVSAEDFGPLLRHEAIRRGMGSAKTIVFLGDGAVWVWKVARLNFPGAVCILDYYHACEHLSLLAAAIYGEGTPQARHHYRLWKKWLLKDKVAQIITQATEELPTEAGRCKTAKLQINYLERNRTKMLYQTFRKAGYFIGSGVTEAGCKIVVGQRLKHSGMLWSRKGAQHLLSIRCALLSGWFQNFWKSYSQSGQALAFAA
jgi:hypothetical protein